MNRFAFLICLFILPWGGFFSIRTEGTGLVKAASGAGGQDESARQLRIYSETLYQGSTEDVRVDAAIGLLLRNDSESRAVLLKALNGTDNPNARVAVCRALIQSRGLGSSVAPAAQFADSLMHILSGSDEGLAKLAAEALLIYRFSEIEKSLTELVKDPQQAPAVRLHGIYVLQLRTEPQALRILIQLLDDSNPDIQRAAETALQEAFGIPVGTNRQVWSAILEQLRQKSPEDIRRERLLRQEMKLREVQEERDRWQRLYLSALDGEYEAQDPAARGKFLLDRLNSDLTALRLWSLQKVPRLTGEADPALRERLLALLGDNDREVRLQTARVLTTMSALNPAEKLLEQYHKETDPKVALALFEALGEACYFAFSPGSSITLPESVHTETLEIALIYLRNEQPATAKVGAEVIRKLLEPNGIDSYEAAVYLTALLERYQQAAAGPQNSTFRGDLLMIMARLAAQGPHKASAGHLFRQAFLEGVGAKESPEVRLAGVTGLIGIDKANALKVCKEQNLTADPSPAIRGVLLDLAAQVGSREDLDWICQQFTKNGSSDSAWQAFRTICQRQGADVYVMWAKRLEEQNVQPDRIRQLWEGAEQKAQAENNASLLENIRTHLLRIYRENNDYLQTLELGKRIRASGGSGLLPAAHPQLLKAALKTQQWGQGETVIREALEKQDLDSSSPLVILVEEFLQSADVSLEQKQLLLKALEKTKMNPNRPEWDKEITSWSQQYITVEPPPEQDKKTPNTQDSASQ